VGPHMWMHRPPGGGRPRCGAWSGRSGASASLSSGGPIPPAGRRLGGTPVGGQPLSSSVKATEAPFRVSTRATAETHNKPHDPIQR